MTSSTREWYLRAARELAATSPRQVEWCRGIADDARMLALLEAVPRPARQPSLLFAVASHLGVPDAPYPAWADAVLARSERLARELPRRRVQTNEPARTVPLAAALARIPGPIALIELGAAAGLCLLPDHYAYRLRTPGGVVEAGEGPPVLEARLDAELVPDLPRIVWRRGVDLAPLDVADAEAVRWLEASLPPDRPERHTRLRQAIEVARRVGPLVVAGDALDTLPALAAEAPRGIPLVVASLGTAVYLPPADRARLLPTIADVGARAVTFEGRAVLPEAAARWEELVAAGRADPDAAFLLAIDGEPIASGSAHGDRLVAVRPAGRTGAHRPRS